MRSPTKWQILGWAALAWVVFTILWAIFFVPVNAGQSRPFETVKFIFLSVSAFGVLFSALLTSFNSLEATANIHEQIDFARTENAFAFLERWNAAELKEARDYTRKLSKAQKTLSQELLIQRIEGEDASHPETFQKDSLKRSVISVVNFFEEIELSTQHRRVKEEILRSGFAETYTLIYERFRPWIDIYVLGEQKANLKQLYGRWTR
jgi:hypothetical protein